MPARQSPLRMIAPPRRYGPRGWWLEATDDGDFARLQQLARRLDAAAPPALAEWVLGPAGLLLLTRRAEPAALVERWLDGADSAPSVPASPARVFEIPVRYDGADLAAVALACGLSADEVVSRHTRPTYRVRLLGFAPGFVYLDGLDPALHLPRREQPRPRVDAGSVAIGGAHAGIYPLPTPGGWHLLGHTDRALFDPRGTPSPCLLAPGDRIRFRPLSR